jgi:hypothetical protein
LLAGAEFLNPLIQESDFRAALDGLGAGCGTETSFEPGRGRPEKFAWL